MRTFQVSPLDRLQISFYTARPLGENKAKFMKSAGISKLESVLREKKLDSTLLGAWPDSAVARVSTGLDELDAMLGGGWRRGEVSEVVGARSTGRTSLLVRTLAAATRRQEIVGLVDTVDRFDPRAAADAGLDLTRVLWVRGPALTVELSRPAAIERALHQAVRAFDLIVRAGGFAIVALDLADVPARHLRALPWTTWLRLAHDNEGRDSVCLLVGETTMGKSPRGTSVHLQATRDWTGDSPQSRRLSGLSIHARAGLNGNVIVSVAC
jgi:RecA/RadA recombinase